MSSENEALTRRWFEEVWNSIDLMTMLQQIDAVQTKVALSG
jgi:hypothetical protein